MTYCVNPWEGLKNAEKLEKKKEEIIKQLDEEIITQKRMYYRYQKEEAEKKLAELKQP